MDHVQYLMRNSPPIAPEKHLQQKVMHLKQDKLSAKRSNNALLPELGEPRMQQVIFRFMLPSIRCIIFENQTKYSV